MVHYDPFSPDAMVDPFPAYREMRDAAPIHRLAEYDAWALPRFEEVWQIAQDREHFSIVEGPVFSREQLLVHNDGPPPSPPARPVRSFSVLDPPVHTALRRAMYGAFTPRACQDLADDVAGIVRSQLDGMADRDRFDVVADLAGPVATVTTLRFLGLPTDDATSLGALVNESTHREPGTPGRSARARAAAAELHERVVAFVVAARRRAAAPPGTDLLGGLLGLRLDDDQGLDDAEIAVQVSTLLVGGAETLPKIIAGGMLRLADHPDQRAQLAADPSLAPQAFEEMLRLEGVLQFVGRTATRDVTIAGVPVRCGQRVLLLLQSANRDEREFPDPESFDIHRRPTRSLAFGHGVHFCIGAHAARLVGITLVRELISRFPDYEVDRDGALRPPSEFQIGWTRLPITV